MTERILSGNMSKRFLISDKRRSKMGTNYYAVKIEPTVREDRIIHIGKSSAGWKFLFHEHASFEYEPELEIHSYNEWRLWIEEHIGNDYVMMNEYDEQVNPSEFFELVEKKQKDGLTAKTYYASQEHADEWAQTRRFLDNPTGYGEKLVDGYRFVDREFS
jgi:hypothetical protein